MRVVDQVRVEQQLRAVFVGQGREGFAASASVGHPSDALLESAHGSLGDGAVVTVRHQMGAVLVQRLLQAAYLMGAVALA